MCFRIFILLTVLLSTPTFFGCGEDMEFDSEIYDDASVVSFEIVRNEPTQYAYARYFVRVVADKVQQTDLFVFTEIHETCPGDKSPTDTDDSGWVRISKGENRSDEHEIVIDLNKYAYVRIRPVPTYEAAGEGEVLDRVELKNWGTDRFSEFERYVPEVYTYIHYKVADLGEIELYRPGVAKIISVDPPSGKIVNTRDEIKIMFDKPPLCPYVTYSPDDEVGVVQGYGAGATSFVAWPRVPDDGNDYHLRITIAWGDAKQGNAGKQTLEYPVIVAERHR